MVTFVERRKDSLPLWKDVPLISKCVYDKHMVELGSYRCFWLTDLAKNETRCTDPKMEIILESGGCRKLMGTLSWDWKVRK